MLAFGIIVLSEMLFIYLCRVQYAIRLINNPDSFVNMMSVVIPAFNEAQRLPLTIVKVREYFEMKKMAYEIIVVDDGSGDGSDMIAKKMGVRLIKYENNLGKGAAVRAGMLAAKGDFVLFSDADLSTPIEEVEKLLARLDNAQVVIGSRSMRGASVLARQSFFRIVIGKIFNKFVRIVAVRGIIDTQCGFKLFSRRAAREIFRRLRLDGFSFDVEALFIGRRLGFSIVEVPVVWRNVRGSKVRPVTDAFRMLRDLFVIRLNDLRGLYA